MLDADRESTFSVHATLSMDKNKVTRLYGDNDVVYNVDSDRNIQKEGNLFLGESRNTIYIWKTGLVETSEKTVSSDFGGRVE